MYGATLKKMRGGAESATFLGNCTPYALKRLTNAATSSQPASAMVSWLAVCLALSLAFVNAVPMMKASEEMVEYLGRFDFSNNQKVANWPGSGVKVNVLSESTTTSVSVQYVNVVTNTKFYILVYVDCEVYKKYEMSNLNPYFITVDLTSTPGTSHELSFVKVTEASNGDATGWMEIGDITVNGGSFLTQAQAQTQRPQNCPLQQFKMLVIGDSITAAYGTDGTFPCTYSASTENVQDGYAVLTAQAIGASIHTVPWSGKGVVRNYGDKNQMSAEPMPLFYNRTIATRSDLYWEPSRYTPDVVLVMLGTNDYSTTPRPSDDRFIAGLVNLLTTIRKDYPKAKIASMCAPMRADRQCINIEAAVQTFKGDVTYVDIDPSTMDGGYGCDYHPSIQSQANIASVVIPAVRKMLGI